MTSGIIFQPSHEQGLALEAHEGCGPAVRLMSADRRIWDLQAYNIYSV